MSTDEQIIHLNHKIGRGEAVLDCMNAIEAMQEVLYEDIEARRHEMYGASVQGYDIDKDAVIIKLRAQVDILYVMHKKLSEL